MTAQTIKPLPKITEAGPEGFLVWLRRDMPDVFEKVKQQVPIVAQWEGERYPSGLGFWGALFSGLGSALTAALPTVANVAGSLAVSNANKKLVDAQARLAAAQSPPIQTGYVINPQTGAAMTVPIQPAQQVPQLVYTTTASGQMATVPRGTVATGAGAASWWDGQTAGIPNKVLAIGGGGLGLLLLFKLLK